MNRINNKFGLVLTEVLMALAMLMVATIVIGSIITSAVSTTSLSKNYLLAHNLAVEAIETVKAVRNTNWLIEPNDKSCWLRREPCMNKSLCPCNDKVLEGLSYTVSQEDGIWHFSSPKDEDLDLNNSSLNPEEYRLYIDSLTGQYIHDPDAGDDPTNFYRSIKFIEINMDVYVVLEVKVQWFEGKKVRSISRKIVLYNYL